MERVEFIVEAADGWIVVVFAGAKRWPHK